MLALAGAAMCAAPARAVTEFCPAVMSGPYAKTESPLVYNYRLHALSPRSVTAVIIADTDRGWFSWTQQLVPLTRMTFTVTGGGETITYVQAESPELAVAFPQVVNVARAWVAVAKTQGEPFLGWDAKGAVVCDPPDFARVLPGRVVTKRTPGVDDPTPAPAPPASVAAPTTAPFPEITCAHPFAAATVTRPEQPVFPDIVAQEGFGATATVEVYVAVDRKGTLRDAWIFAKSGYPPLDQSALVAARKSSYANAVSYCRPVTGLYLFRADFSPY